MNLLFQAERKQSLTSAIKKSRRKRCVRGRIFRSNQYRPFRKSGAFKQGEIIDLDDWEDNNKSPKKRAKPVRHGGGIVCISDDEEDDVTTTGRVL